MKAISLFSGGLDSQLAAILIKQQGIEVIGVNFKSPFFGDDASNAQAAENLGIDFRILDMDNEYLDKVLKNPVYGYGKNMNPCIDCHAYMLRKAGEFMQESGASFLITGEVVGQRPMSQNKSALNAVDKLSGLKGFIVRPLSAKLLPITIPEEKGWIDRNQLLDISGRGRNRQMELAEAFGIHDYPTPAGGCLLTESKFAGRLRKLLEVKPDSKIDEINICRVGRHIYIGDNNLLVVGRNHAENEYLQNLATASDYLFKVIDRPGPLGLLQNNNVTTADLEFAAAIVARYSDAKNDTTANVKVFHLDDPNENVLVINPLPAEKVPASV